MLDIDGVAASAALTTLPFDFAFGLRDYQMRGIQAFEAALADDGRRALLLAMATGTGKTKLAVAMLYRLLHTRRFRRICFVVAVIKRGGLTPPQQQWLRRIGTHVAEIDVADPAVLDQGQFREAAGGFTRLDRVFGGRLAGLLGDINEAAWKDTA